MRAALIAYPIVRGPHDALPRRAATLPPRIHGDELALAESGVVTLEVCVAVCVAVDGSVTRARLARSTGRPWLDTALERVAWTWRYARPLEPSCAVEVLDDEARS